MVDDDQMVSYWKQTIINALISTAFFIFVIVFVLAAYGLLNDYQFLGFPLGLFVLVLGGPVLAIVLVVRHCMVQDHIDARFGANEDI